MKFFLIFLCLGSSVSFSEEIWVVSGKDSPSDPLTLKQVKEVFLGNPQKTSSGEWIIAIERKGIPDDLRIKFYRSALEMSRTQVKSYWSQRVFTARGYPPKSAADLKELKKFLQEDSSAVSYVYPQESDADLKVRLKINADK